MKRSLIYSTLLCGALLTGCKSIPPAYLSMTPQEIEASDNFRLERKNSLLPLKEKVSYLENLIERDLVEIGEGKLLPTAIYKTGQKPLYIEQNTTLLSALSFKYGVTQDKETKHFAEIILKGIIEMDKLNGYDGFIPYEVNGNTFETSLRNPHANNYSQLLFAYTIMNETMGRQALVEEHVSKIYSKWLSDDFELRDLEGKKIEYTDLKGPLMYLDLGRTLDRRMLDQSAYILGDTKTKVLAENNRWNGKVHFPSHLNLNQWEIPTSSSSWLNMLEMYSLGELGRDHSQKLLELAHEYKSLKNPFFQTLAFLSNPEVDISFIEERLKEYPVPVKAGRIVNSHRKEIELRAKRVIKSTIKPESKNPLPLYEISSDHYLWKRNFLELDRRSDAEVKEYYGVDFLQAYWMFEYAKMKNQNSPIR